MILLDAGDRVLPAVQRDAVGARLAPRCSAQGLGVTVREGARSRRSTPRGVTIDVDGETERSRPGRVIWAAGVHAVR